MKILIHSRLNKQNIFWYDYTIATAIATHNPHSQPSTFTKGHLQHVVFWAVSNPGGEGTWGTGYT